MNTSVIDTQVKDYLDAVRHQLADLPSDELEELSIDLEAHLIEVLAERPGSLVERLGSPEAYAAELRASADYGSTGRRGPFRGAFDAAMRRLERVVESDRFRAARETWSRSRPAWIWLRGWLVVMLWAVLAASPPSLHRFPIPPVSSAFFGIALVAGATALSLYVARRASVRRRYASLDGGFTALALLLTVWSLVFASNAPPENLVEGYVDPGAEMLLGVTNIYPFDLEGNAIEGVLLYDQNGAPIDLHPWETADLPEIGFHLDRFGRAVKNAYPLELRVPTWDSLTERDDFIVVPPPDVAIPRLPETSRPQPPTATE